MGAEQLPALSPPTLVPHTHSDDLGIELSWQAGHAGLGAEEAVESLHGTRCHQLQRHGVRRGGSASNPLSPYSKAGSALENPSLLQLCCVCTASLFHSSQARKLSWALFHLHPAFPGSQLTAERT